MGRSDEESWGVPLPQLLCEESELGNVELFNAYFLAGYVSDLAIEWQGRFFFSPEIIRECNRLAMTGIYQCAGEYRNRPVTAGNFVGARHRDIALHVEAMCEYVNSQLDDPFHAAAYILWRTNWIHPFYDGNGRVSRELSYLALLAGLGVEEPDSMDTIPSLIDRETNRYMECLRLADTFQDDGLPNLAPLQSMICELSDELFA